MNWIKVSEQMPESNRMVIVACYGSDIIMPNEGESIGECVARLQRECIRVTLGFIDEEGFWNGADYFPMMIAPTFWQPLPEPPIPQPQKIDKLEAENKQLRERLASFVKESE